MKYMDSTVLTGLRRDEEAEKLDAMPDRDLAEMIRAHFDSHPALPGEKAFRDEINQKLKSLEPDENGFAPAGSSPFTDEDYKPGDENKATLWEDPADKMQAANKFAKTLIRETPLKEGNAMLDFHNEAYDPSKLKRNPVDEIPQNNGGGTIYVDRVDVELSKETDPEALNPNAVYVTAQQSDGSRRLVGSLPDSFLANNPMNVDRCGAELEITDYSNGNMKNISTRVVVNTDLMSGDVIDLDEDMISGLEQGQADDLNQ